ncbi:hypothetical protein L9F63_012871, partial [Diploptera punctata]
LADCGVIHQDCHKHWQRAFGPSGCHIDYFQGREPETFKVSDAAAGATLVSGPSLRPDGKGLPRMRRQFFRSGSRFSSPTPTRCCQENLSLPLLTLESLSNPGNFVDYLLYLYIYPRRVLCAADTIYEVTDRAENTSRINPGNLLQDHHSNSGLIGLLLAGTKGCSIYPHGISIISSRSRQHKRHYQTFHSTVNNGEGSAVLQDYSDLDARLPSARHFRFVHFPTVHGCNATLNLQLARLAASRSLAYVIAHATI